MMDIIAKNDERLRATDRAERFADPEWRNGGGDWCVPQNPGPSPICPQQKTATARWQQSVLIIAALSALSWAAVIFLLIAALSAG